MNLIPWRSKRNGNGIRDTSRELDILRFRSEVDRMIDGFLRDPFGLSHETNAALAAWAPSLDVVETDGRFTLKAELPGVDPKDLDITISGNVLTLSGEKNESTEEKGDRWYHSERRFGTFRRCVQLPSYVDAEKVSAEHVNGVLTLHFDKLSSAAPKRVPVKACKS